jgi:hypothetical protein
MAAVHAPNLRRMLVDSSIGMKTTGPKKRKAKNEFDGGKARVEEHDADEWKTIRRGTEKKMNLVVEAMAACGT